MLDSNFSLTCNFLNSSSTAENDHGSRYPLKQRILVPIGTSITSAFDTLFHTVSCILKLATGIIATPFFVLTGSDRLKNWTWIAANKHFVKAFKHLALVVILPGFTFFFLPIDALRIFFNKTKTNKQTTNDTDQLYNLSQTVNKQHSRIVELGKQLKTSKEDVENEKKCCEGKIKSIKNKLEIAENKIGLQETAIKQKDNRIEELKKGSPNSIPNPQYRVTSINLQPQLNSKIAELSRKDTELKNKDAELRSKDAELKSKDNELRGKINEIHIKATQLKQKDDQINQFKIQITKLEADNQKNRNVYSAHITNVDSQINTHKLLATKLRNKTERLTADCQQSQENLKIAITQMNPLKDRIDTLQNQIKLKDIQIARHDSQIAIKDNAIGANENTIKKSRAQIQSLEAECQQRRKELEIANAQARPLKDRIDDLTNQIKLHDTVVESIEAEHQRLRNVNGEIEKDNESLKTQLTNALKLAAGKIPEVLIGAIDALARELTCPVTLELINESAIVLPCRHKFEKHVVVHLVAANNATKAKAAASNKAVMKDDLKDCPLCQGPLEGFHEGDMGTKNVSDRMEYINQLLLGLKIRLEAL